MRGDGVARRSSSPSGRSLARRTPSIRVARTLEAPMRLTRKATMRAWVDLVLCGESTK